MFDRAGTLCDCDFYVAAFGPRLSGVANTPAGVAVNDVRNRICVDGVEPAQYRLKLNAFARDLASRFGWKHRSGEGDETLNGLHDDLVIPRGIALMRAGAATNVPGNTVWSRGLDLVNYIPVAGSNIGHRIEFRTQRGVRWVGARIMPVHNSATITTTEESVPKIVRPPESDPRMRQRRGYFDLGTANLSRVKQALVQVYGVRT